MDLGISLGTSQVVLNAQEAPAGSKDIFVVIGQSNAVGYAEDDGGAGYPAGTQHWTSVGNWAPIGFRLDHGPWEDVALPTQFGFAKSFAAAVQAANPLSDLFLIGAADGGTGFVTGHWTSGSAHYQAVVSRINTAISAAPAGAVLRGFLWHQGESDRNSVTYDDDLAQLVVRLRNDVLAATAQTPFVVGGHATDGAWWDPFIQRSTQALPSEVAYCGYANVADPAEPGLGDGVHFDAAATRGLGQAYFKALNRASANTTTVPSRSITTGTPVYTDLTLSASWQSSGLNIGPEAADRIILIALANRHDNTLPRPSQVLLGGTPATRIVQRSTGRVSGTNVALYLVSMPTGSTADLSVIFDLPPQQVGAVLLPIYDARPDLASVDGFDFSVGLAGHGTNLSTQVQAQAGDLVFAACGAIAPGGANGQINLGGTTDNLISGTNRSLHTGHRICPASGSQTVTCDFGTTVVNYPTIAAVVLRPV